MQSVRNAMSHVLHALAEQVGPAPEPPPQAHDNRYDAATALGTKTLVHPQPGQPINNDHAAAADRFAQEQTTWTAAQTNIGQFNFAQIDAPQNNHIKGRLKRAGVHVGGRRREVKFIDRKGIDRTAGSKFGVVSRVRHQRNDVQLRNPNLPGGVSNQPAGWMPVFQYTTGQGYAADPVLPGVQKRLPKTQVHLAFRPMLPETESVLQAYIDGNAANIANIFLREGFATPPTTKQIMDDLTERLTDGPLFNMRTTKLIMNGIYGRLESGVHIDTELFKVGVEVLTNNLLTNMFDAHKVRDKYTVHPIKKRDIQQKAHPQTQRILRTFSPPTAATVEQNVYRQALMVATVTEACMAAASRVDEANQDHTKHVAIGIAFAFAGIKAILDVAPAPAHLGAVVGEFFEPIKQAILYKHGKKYTSQTMLAVVEGEYAKLKSDAESGYIVPGLNNEPAVRSLYRASVGEDNVTRFVHEERRAWGAEFIKSVENIRPYGR